MIQRRYLNFWLFLGAMAGGFAVASIWVDAVRAGLLGFDAGVVVFIVSALHMFDRSKTEDIRQRAKANDPDHRFLLFLAMFVVSVVLVTVAFELTGNGVALAGGTLLLAWLFSNLVIAIHYCHQFYSPGDEDGAPERGDGEAQDSGGLRFPGDALPDYGDFAYFAFVLGMTFQVSDVEITSRSMRRLALFHSIAAFLFNIVVVALSVSLIGTMMK